LKGRHCGLRQSDAPSPPECRGSISIVPVAEQAGRRVRERLFAFGSREAVAEPVAGERSGVQNGGPLHRDTHYGRRGFLLLEARCPRTERNFHGAGLRLPAGP
jgi:hypothetical protein